MFDDLEGAESLLGEYKNRVLVKDFDGPKTLSTAKHLLSARCGEVGFIVGGDELEVVGQKGTYTEEDIETGYEKWCAYWKIYWELRGTDGAYPKDYVCEITIPINGD